MSTIARSFLFLLFAAASAAAESYTFKTLAGNVGAGSIDGTRSVARFNGPFGVAVDSVGNVYVADQSNHTIRRITPAGAVATLAGLAGASGSIDAPGSGARFRNPAGVAIDSAGTLYVADQSNHTIRRITAAGTVTTLAGLAGVAGNADGTGSSARFNNPAGLAVDAAGNVYVADRNNHTIRKIAAGGIVTTLAGLAGTFGSADGTATAARFNNPHGIAIGSSGILYVADRSNHAIRKITSGGVVTTPAGLAGTSGSADGIGNIARFNRPAGVAMDSDGNVYVADQDNNTIRKMTPDGVVTTSAGFAGSSGSADGIGIFARFDGPCGMAVDGADNVYVADQRNNVIRKITAVGVVTTLGGMVGNAGIDDGIGSLARFHNPTGVATDGTGNIYVADRFNHTIRKILPGGIVTTFAGMPGVNGHTDGTGDGALFYRPTGVATDSAGNVYVADQGNQTIRKIDSEGAVTTIAGKAGFQGSLDGSGQNARFADPSALATDSATNVYVADFSNHTIRKITPEGVVTTLAGSPGSSGSADGTGSTARFNQPFGVATDSDDNLYVADQSNQTIRKMTPGGTVTTLAGLAGTIGTADGTGTAARFHNPTGVAVDSSGNVYVADQVNETVRKITPEGVLTTLAGQPLTVGCLDGTGSAAQFFYPTGVAVDGNGNVFVADQFNHLIRVGTPALPDGATIDFSTGPIGATRQLDAAPQTATSWQWSLIRRPASSIALLSSSTTRNPTFTPDAADLYTFRLVASNGANSSITTVDLTVTAGSSTTTLTATPNPSLFGQSVTLRATVTSAGGTPTGTVTFYDGATMLGSAALIGDAVYTTSALTPGSHSISSVYAGEPNFTGSTSSTVTQIVVFAPPQGVTATATSSTGVMVTWLVSPGAASYEIARSSSGLSFEIIDSSTTNSWNDSTASPNTAYLYIVRAVGSAGDRSIYSGADLATTVLFTDDPLVAQTTAIKAVHLTQLRTAVQAVAALAGLAAMSFTDGTINSAVSIKAIHVSELRNRLNAARGPLALPALTYTDALTTGATIVKAMHFQELRNGVK